MNGTSFFLFEDHRLTTSNQPVEIEQAQGCTKLSNFVKASDSLSEYTFVTNNVTPIVSQLFAERLL